MPNRCAKPCSSTSERCILDRATNARPELQMADIVSKETRSRMMSNIRGGNTKPEMALRRALHQRGIRYRLHVKDLPGKPDLVFPRHKAVLFVHGCFWHRHEGCRFATTPSSNVAFWKRKFDDNVKRDRRSVEALLASDWRVGLVWECFLRKPLGNTEIEEITAFVKGRETYREWPSTPA